MKKAAAAACRVIAITNAKGGVGKTTSTSCIGTSLAQRGKRVLLIDLDWQADLSKCFGVDAPAATVGQVLLSQVPLERAIVGVSAAGEAIPNLSILPSSPLLSVQEPKIRELANYHALLRDKLRKVAKEYDYVLLDCPPALGPMTYLAFVAADGYLVPCAPEMLSFNKLKLIRDVAESIRQNGLNSQLRLLGIFFTKHNPRLRKRLHSDVVRATQQLYGVENVLPSIRENLVLAEAQTQAVPAQLSSPQTNGVQDYELLTTAVEAAFA